MAACPACGATLRLVRVHGHGQCAACGVNVEPCCGGAGQESDALESGTLPSDVQTLVALVRAEGPLLRQAVLNRLAEVAGVDHARGDDMLHRAVSAGLIESLGSNIYRA